MAGGPSRWGDIMKNPLISACSALVALLLPSCFEHTSTIRLEKDGGGTITEETILGAQASAMLAGLPSGDGEDPLSQMADPDKAAKAAAEMGEGVTVEKVEKIDKDGRKGGRVVYRFRDINTLKYTFGKSMSDTGDAMPGAEEKKADEPLKFTYKDGKLTLKRPDVKKAEQPELPEGAQEIDAQELAMAQGMFKDMKMALKLEIAPGIGETNATHVAGDTITIMEMQFDKLIADPEKFKKFSQLKPETPAEMEKALEGVEGVKFETKEELTVTVK